MVSQLVSFSTLALEPTPGGLQTRGMITIHGNTITNSFVFLSTREDAAGNRIGSWAASLRFYGDESPVTPSLDTIGKP